MKYYGGILVLIKQGFLQNYISIPSNSEKIAWVRIPLTKGKRLMLGVVYKAPQNSSYSNESTWDLLEEEMRHLRCRYENDYFLVVGDFNAYIGLM